MVRCLDIIKRVMLILNSRNSSWKEEFINSLTKHNICMNGLVDLAETLKKYGQGTLE